MSQITTNSIDSPHQRTSKATENLTKYFSNCKEVSSVFVRPAARKANDVAGAAVLVRDAGLDAGELARLEAHYTSVASSWGLGRVEVLNTSPVSQQYQVVKDWSLVFERNRAFRTWFYEQAAGAHLAQQMVV